MNYVGLNRKGHLKSGLESPDFIRAVGSHADKATIAKSVKNGSKYLVLPKVCVIERTSCVVFFMVVYLPYA